MSTEDLVSDDGSQGEGGEDVDELLEEVGGVVLAKELDKLLLEIRLQRQGFSVTGTTKKDELKEENYQKSSGKAHLILIVGHESENNTDRRQRSTSFSSEVVPEEDGARGSIGEVGEQGLQSDDVTVEIADDETRSGDGPQRLRIPQNEERGTTQSIQIGSRTRSDSFITETNEEVSWRPENGWRSGNRRDIRRGNDRHCWLITHK